MSLKDSIIYGLENIGNEGLYPLIELMDSIGWDPINTQEYLNFIKELEYVFIYLYNNKNNTGNNKNVQDAHRYVHYQLHEALKITLQKKEVDLFHSSLERSANKRYMFAFSSNFKNILAQHPEGLKKSLILYNEMYHIMRINDNTLHAAKDLSYTDDPIKRKVEEAVVQCKKYAKNDLFENCDQFKQFMLDKKCLEILNKNLFSSQSQLAILAEKILQDTQLKFFDSTITHLNQYIIEENFTIEISEYLQELIEVLYSIFNNHENPHELSIHLNKLANLPLVKSNKRLRAFLGERLSIKTKFDQEPSDILKCYDDQHTLLDFKPDLVKQVQEKFKLEILFRIKSDFSRRIYKNDGLIERYLPISMKGLKTNPNAINQLLYAYDDNRQLSPIGPLNEMYHSHPGGHYLYLLFNAVIKDFCQEEKISFTPLTYDDLFKRDSANNLVGFTKKFHHLFIENDINLHQFLIYLQLIKIIGMNAYIENILNLPTIEKRIEKLCCDHFNRGNGDKLYTLLSAQVGKSIDLKIVFEETSHKEKKSNINKQFWKIVPALEDKITLLAQLLLINRPQSYYDIEKSVYQKNITTRHAMQHQSLRHVFTLEKEKKLFRNSVETRQHVPADDEYNDLQVGDTQGSNISLTQIGDIATAYASNNHQEGTSPAYGWIIIYEPQKAVNCSHYMEKHTQRLPAQEFSVGALKANQFLGAIKVRRLHKDEPGFIHNKKRVAYKIEDGFVSLPLLKQFSQANNADLLKTVKLYGLEDEAAHYLSRAIIFTRARQEGGAAKKLLDKMKESQYHHYTTSANPTRTDRVRTQYQEQFDALSSRRDTIKQKFTDKRKISQLRNKKKITNKRFFLFDPDSLRHYHKRLNIDFFQTHTEHSNLQRLYLQRLQAEKQIRRNEKNFSQEMFRFTNFSNLSLDTETQEYVTQNYSPFALKQIESLKQHLPNPPTFQGCLSYIKNMFDFDEILTVGKIKSITSNIYNAVNELYSVDFCAANNELSKLFNNYYQLKKPPIIQGSLITPLISAIIEKNSSFFSNTYFSPNVQMAIDQLNKKSTDLEYYFNKIPKDSFLENLKWSLEFVDITNILTEIVSPHNNIRTVPWRLYQSKHDAQSDRQLNTWKAVANQDYPINADGLNRLFEDLTRGENFSYEKGDLFSKIRDFPIIAGGGLDKNGHPIPPHILTDRSVCTQYFRITEEQLDELKANMFITVLSAHTCDHRGRFGADYLVKYRYPDCRDVEKLSHKYKFPPNIITKTKSLLHEFVPNALANALWPNIILPIRIDELSNEQFSELMTGEREYGELIDTYQKNLNDPSSYPKPTERVEVQRLKNQYESKLNAFRKSRKENDIFFKNIEKINKLTQKVLHNLVENVANDKTLSAIERYQKLISIHPFQDMNGRSLRMFYRQEEKKPLYMLNWDLDIVLPAQQTKTITSLNNFSHFEFNKYISMVGALHKTYFQEKAKKDMPKYYDSTEFLMSIFGINSKYYTKADLTSFHEFFSNFYLSYEIQRHVEKKSYFDYMHLIMENIYTWDKFQFNSYSDLNNNTPLHMACLYHFSKRCLEKLLAQADSQRISVLQLQNKKMQNPAHFAAQSLNIEALTLLWKHSPELLQQLDNQGKSPYDMLLEKLKLQITNATLNKETLAQFITFAQSLDTSQYDVTEYRFDGNATLAHLLAQKNDKVALHLLLTALPNFEFKQDNDQNTPKNILNKRLYLPDSDYEPPNNTPYPNTRRHKNS